MFSTSWGGSICIFHKCSHYGKNGIYNLHGLWPNASNGHHPFNCYQTYFRESDYNSYIKKNIYNYWNSFYNPNWGFIKHEITKHGTCWDSESGDKTVMNSKLVSILDNLDINDDIDKLNGYLSLAIEVSKIVNPYQQLELAGIVPGEGMEYSVDDIIKVFNDKYGLYTAIPICLTDRSSGKMYMTELRFCLDLNYNPAVCENINFVKGKIKACRKMKISYPSFPN